MSDAIKHECGIALLRLKKPLSYYYRKYGTSFYGLTKLYLLLEKQHNRGQDGAGVVNIKLNNNPGTRYISRARSNGQNPIQEVFEKINRRFIDLEKNDPQRLKDPAWLKSNLPYTGELFLGHVRYGTFGKNSIETVHPFLRQNNWKTRNLVAAGNFNLTNVDELFELLVSIGQHPKERSDTVTVLEKIGHFLDVENQELFEHYKKLGYSNVQISEKIAQKIDIPNILKRAAADWDGGYAMAGLIGHGDGFVFRDPSGIRPAFYYDDEELFVVTSERPVIQTAFNVPFESIKELTPGHVIVVKNDGTVSETEVLPALERKSCSFERIYFSRGSDKIIYEERKALGRNLADEIWKAIDGDLENTVFSYIPNTAETAFYGMLEGMNDRLNKIKKEKILKLGPKPDDKKLTKILESKVRTEKITIKDAKLRTFITQDDARDDMVAHVYDITYGTVRPGQDTLVIIDDSIVRGTTLKKSILRILDRLNPRKIIVVSSAPQIRYPDCYGIDMAKMGDFIAFQAAIAKLVETHKTYIIDQVYKKSKEQEKLDKEWVRNHVKEIFDPFSAKEISEKIAELLTPRDMKAPVEIIYQSIEGLHKSCPNDTGDWYFTGDYPTPGGNKVVNKAFINYIEGKNERAY